MTLPPVSSLDVDALKLSRQERNAYWNVLSMLEQRTSAPLHRLLGHPDTCYVEYNSWQRQFILLTTPPAQAWGVLSVPSTFPAGLDGARTTGSGVGSLRLSGRRAPARGIPMLRGTTCPSFARCVARSCAARRRASAPSQGMTYRAHEGMGSSAGSR